MFDNFFGKGRKKKEIIAPIPSSPPPTERRKEPAPIYFDDEYMQKFEGTLTEGELPYYWCHDTFATAGLSDMEGTKVVGIQTTGCSHGLNYKKREGNFPFQTAYYDEPRRRTGQNLGDFQIFAFHPYVDNRKAAEKVFYVTQTLLSAAEFGDRSGNYYEETGLIPRISIDKFDNLFPNPTRAFTNPEFYPPRGQDYLYNQQKPIGDPRILSAETLKSAELPKRSMVDIFKELGFFDKYQEPNDKVVRTELTDFFYLFLHTITQTSLNFSTRKPEEIQKARGKMVGFCDLPMVLLIKNFNLAKTNGTALEFIRMLSVFLPADLRRSFFYLTYTENTYRYQRGKRYIHNFMVLTEESGLTGAACSDVNNGKLFMVGNGFPPSRNFEQLSGVNWPLILSHVPETLADLVMRYAHDPERMYEVVERLMTETMDQANQMLDQKYSNEPAEIKNLTEEIKKLYWKSYCQLFKELPPRSKN